MKTQYYTATSLDGFIATEDDSLEWLFPLGNVADTSYPEFIAEVGALVMGASTYEWMIRHATKLVEETGASWPYAQPTWVFTHRRLPLAAADADIRFVQGDVRLVHSQMAHAAAGKNIWVVGGGDLAEMILHPAVELTHDAGERGAEIGQRIFDARRHLGEIAPRDEAEINIMGEGTVRLMTEPDKVETNVMGSGKVIHAAGKSI